MHTLRIVLFVFALAGALAGPAPAQEDRPPRLDRVLAVVGEGIVRGRPDMAVITMGVVSEARTAGEALEASSASMTRIR